MSFMLRPRKSQRLKAREIRVPKKAPFEFANGKNKPSIKRPKIGPPVILNIKKLLFL